MYQKKPVLFQLQHYICPQNAKNFGKNYDLRKVHTFQLLIHHHHQLNLSEHDLFKLNMNEHGWCNHSHIHSQVQTPQRKLLMHYYILIDKVGGQNGKIYGSCK